MHATSVSSAGAEESSVNSNGKTAVVVGAGPAGLLAACSLARQGFAVHVLERRPDLLQQAASSKGTYIMSVGTRGVKPMAELGMRLPTDGWLDGLSPMHGAVIHPLDGRPPMLLPYAAGRVVLVERNDLAAHMLREARRIQPSITYTFEAQLQAVHFKERTVTYASPASASSSIRYDLLVAADGAGSQVRNEAVAQIPGFKASRTNCDWMTTVAHSLPPVLNPTPGGKDAPADGVTGRYVNFFPTKGAHERKGNPFTHGFFAWPRQDGRFSILITRWHDISIPSDVAAINSLLRAAQPALPEEWYAPISQQLQAAEWIPFGSSVQVSQLAEPSAGFALIGDAAHGVTPHLGQGANSSAETADILCKALQQYSGDIRRGLQAFQQARFADVQALRTLDRRCPSFWHRRSGLLPFNIGRLENVANMWVSGRLHRLAPRLFRPSGLAVRFDADPPIPYSEILGDRQRDLRILLALVAACVFLVVTVAYAVFATLAAP